MTTTAYSLGNWIRRRRRMLDLTQDQLADLAGCSLSAIRKFEADERRPSLELAERLAAALQIAGDERTAFLHVARQEAAVDRLPPIAAPAALAGPDGHAPGQPRPMLPQPPTLTVQLLGPPLIEHAGHAVTFPTRKAIALLAYLSLEPGPHERSTLAALLWPQSGQAEAQGALRYTLSVLKQAIGAQWLAVDRWTLALQPGQGFTCDVSLFTACLQSTATHGHPTGDVCRRCREPLEQALALYRADFMAGFTLDDSPSFDEWQRSCTLDLRDKLTAALDRLTRLDIAQSAWEQATAHARQRLALDPLHEPAHQQLMRIYAWTGRRTAALNQYRTCAELLDRELGVGPSTETQALHRAIAEHQLPPPPLAPELPAAALSAVGAAGAQAGQPAASPPVVHLRTGLGAADAVVAREAELTRLHHWLRQAAAGEGQICFICGEAGSGKSTLLQEFAHTAAANADVLVAAAHCTAFTGAGDPLQPFRDLLAHLLAQPLPELPEIMLREGPDLLALAWPTVPEAGLPAHWAAAGADTHARLRDLLARSRANSPAVDTQAQLFAEAAAVLRALAAERTLLLLIDDLQWADPSSLALLFHLGQSLATARLMLAGAYRPDDVEAGRLVDGHWTRHPLIPIVDELRRQRGEIEIDLDHANAAGGPAFVDALLDRQPNHLDESFRAALLRQTEGHPLFTVELLAELQTNGSLARDAAGYWTEQAPPSWNTLPARIEAVLANQFGRADETLRELLEIAGVEGDTFTVEVLAHVQGRDTLAVLQRLVHARGPHHNLVQPVAVEHVNGKRITHCRFRHFLLQQYIYRQIDPAAQAYLHAEVGTALEELYGVARDRIAVQLAHHFQIAGATPKAIHYFTVAGQRALRLAATEEALLHLRQAKALLDAWPPTPDNVGDRMRLELPLQMALGVAHSAYYGLGGSAGGEAFARAAEISRQIEGMPQLGLILRGLGSFLLARGEYAEARRQWGSLLALAQRNSDPELLGLAHLGLGTALFYLAEFAKARHHLELALTFPSCQPNYGPTDVQNHLPAATCLTNLSLVLWSLGCPDQAVARSDEARAIATAADHPSTIAHVLLFAATLRQYRREWQAAKTLMEETVAWATQHHLPHWELLARNSLGMVLVDLGDVKTGLALMDESMNALIATGSVLAMPEMLANLGRAHALIGDTLKGLRLVDSAIATAEAHSERYWEPEVHRLRAEVLLLASPPDEAAAEASLRRALAIAEQQQAKSYALRAALGLHRLLQRQGRAAEGLALVSPLYHWFTEGFTTPDLLAAAALLRAAPECAALLRADPAG